MLRRSVRFAAAAFTHTRITPSTLFPSSASLPLPPTRLLLIFVFAQGAEHAAAEATAVAADNALAVPLFISGATCVNAAGINGLFEPTQEKGADGRVLYAKRGDISVCMEHAAGTWQIKDVSSKGTDDCFASVEGGCAAEACTSRQWMVSFDSKTFSDAPHVKMVVESEVCRCCVPLNAFLTANLPFAAFSPTDAPSQSTSCY